MKLSKKEEEQFINFIIDSLLDYYLFKLSSFFELNIDSVNSHKVYKYNKLNFEIGKGFSDSFLEFYFWESYSFEKYKPNIEALTSRISCYFKECEKKFEEFFLSF